MQLFTANSFNAVDWVDKLVYSYAPKSNQLQNVIDLADSQSSGITNGGFKDVYTAGNKYIYGDLNGNMTKDNNKDINYIRYNHLNLPTQVMFNSGSYINYTYDALGTKLAKQVTSGSASTFTYYAGAFIYEQDSTGEKLAFFSQPEGYVEKNGSAFSYVYQHKDHLGNVRLSYKNTSTTGVALQIVEENNYYPFGLKHKGYNNVITGRDHKYGFGGKEEQDELGLEWIDITARNYDPALGRWMNLDPMAEEYYSYSPYAYVINNPLSFNDPTGMTHNDVIINGSESQLALNELQASVSSELTLSMNSDGKVSYEKNDSETKLSKDAQQLVDAIDDRTINVNIYAADTVDSAQGNLFIGGAFMGNDVMKTNLDEQFLLGDASYYGYTVEAYQDINPRILSIFGKENNTPGRFTLHEVTEAYLGAKIAKEATTSTAPATLADMKNPDSVYSKSHVKAVNVTMQVIRSLYDASGKQTNDLNKVKKAIFTTPNGTELHTENF